MANDSSLELDEGPTTFVRTLFECTECQAHRLPMRTSAALYNAEEFKTHPSVPVKVIFKTWSYQRAQVEMYAEGGELFAVCPLSGTKFSESVERTNGSSRYFALKVQNEAGKRLFLGLSFKERTEAFDFVSALQEWDERKEQTSADAMNSNNEGSADGSSISDSLSNVSLQDLSIKEGTKITLKLNVANKPSRTEEEARQDQIVSPASKGLAPPPSAARARSRGQRKTEGS